MNDEAVDCLLCYDEKMPSEVITLRCKHSFCLLCSEKYISVNLSTEIKCPEDGCNEKFSDSQIRSILPDENIIHYESLILDNLDLIHNCILQECDFKIEYENSNTQYECPNCSLYNCITCHAAHAYLSCEKFKCLTESAAKNLCKNEMDRARKIILKRTSDENRKSILKTSKLDLLVNQEVFECILCCLCISKGKGIKLRNCFHLVCRDCLCEYIKNIDKIPPKCPNGYCKCIIEEREIKEILSESDYQLYMRKSINRVKPKLINYFQCQTPDCDFFCEINDIKMKTLKCQKCKAVNCLSCKAIHKGETCEKYQRRIESTDIGINKKFIEEQIKQGKCMKCPDCHNLVQKIRGCNWIQCSNCGVELCWILQMRRWGPGGRGDTTGGCKCMVDEKYCHPDCKGCIPHDEGSECCIM